MKIPFLKNWFSKKAFGTYLGVEITDATIKIVEMEWSEEGSRIEKWCIEPLSQGLIEDGRIKQPGAVAESLQQVLNKYDIRTKFVHFSLPSQLSMIRFLKLPNLPKSELRKMVDFEVKHNMHLPFEQTVYDFLKFEEDFSEPVKVRSSKFKKVPPVNEPDKSVKNECEVMLVASSKSTVEEYREVISLAGLSLKSVEVKALSMFRMLEYKKAFDLRNSFMTIDINDSTTDIHIFQNGHLKTSRSVPISFKNPMPFIPEEVQDENGYFAEYAAGSSQFDTACLELTHETDRLLNYYRHRLDSEKQPISAIIVSGEVLGMEEIVAILENQFKEIPIACLGNESFAAIPNDRFSALVIPVGLALRGNQM